MDKLDEKKEQALVDNAKSVSKWFEVSVRIKIFGQTIFEWVWPPQKS